MNSLEIITNEEIISTVENEIKGWKKDYINELVFSRHLIVKEVCFQDDYPEPTLYYRFTFMINEGEVSLLPHGYARLSAIELAKIEAIEARLQEKLIEKIKSLQES